MVVAVGVAGRDLLVAVAEGGVWGEDRSPPCLGLRDQAVPDLRCPHQ